MYLGTLSPKEVAESFPVYADFEHLVDLAAGETVPTKTVTAKRLSDGVDTSATFLSGPPTVTGARVIQKVTGGVNGEIHRLQFRITTSAGSTFECEIDVPVEEY
jgi:hypothetical protein